MKTTVKTKQKTEFGDFQTPPALVRRICEVVARTGFQPRTMVEPTCGIGNFLAGLDIFPTVEKVLGFDVSPVYVEEAKARFQTDKIQIEQADFFAQNWAENFNQISAPILVFGNPPWVTNSGLGAINGKNIPIKENFQKLNGLDALTGKSNFDVSEWILIKLFEVLKNRRAILAMLCKTSVARKLFGYAAKNKIGFSRFEIRRINALEYFNASTDACLLICDFQPSHTETDCKVYNKLEDCEPSKVIAMRNNQLVASLEKFEKWNHLNGRGLQKWRSGIKHDCAKVMELTKEGDKFRNGFGKIIELEAGFVYPLLKSSDLSKGGEPRKFVIVPQRRVRDETAEIAETAPQTWQYLLSYSDLLDKRASSIYQYRPRFSVFGIGDYSFSDWKVAISGLYKELRFRVVGNFAEKPIMLDDTCYFLPCKSKHEANLTAEMLNSEISREFYESFIFWDAKRPITSEILQKLNLLSLEKELETR